MKKAEYYLNTYYTFVDDIKDLDPHINKLDLIEVIKIVQRETIRSTVQVCADSADADVTFCGWLAEESLNSGEPFEEEEDYEVYVIESSILEVADKLIKELE